MEIEFKNYLVRRDVERTFHQWQIDLGIHVVMGVYGEVFTSKASKSLSFI